LQGKFPYIVAEVNKRLRAKDVLYRVQIGAFRNKSNAEDLLAKAKSAGFKDAFITKVQ
jgi:cell division septation protein DedD